MSKKKERSQYSDLINHLNQNKTITSMEAFQMFGITRLSALIFDLRKDGFNIVTEIQHYKNKYGNTTNYAKYILKEDN